MLTPVSTGLRFTTLPQATTPGSPLASPPTTLTLLYNPLIGFISSAYSAQISPTVALSSRFGVNIYSYEADLSIGGEWWVGRRRGKRDIAPDEALPPSVPAIPGPGLRGEDEIAERQLDSPFPIVSVRESSETEKRLDSPVPIVKAFTDATRQANRFERQKNRRDAQEDSDRDGVLKARLSGNWVSHYALFKQRMSSRLVSGFAIRGEDSKLLGIGRCHLGSGCKEANTVSRAGAPVFLLGLDNFSGNVFLYPSIEDPPMHRSHRACQHA